MEKKSFEEQDQFWMDAVKADREKKVPPAILKGFSASVEAKIRQNQPSLEIKYKPKRAWIPVWAPVFAVMILGSLLVLRLPAGVKEVKVASVKTIELAQANVIQLSDEIAVLREIGAWTDEDEKATGILSESEAEDLELSIASLTDIRFA